MFTGPDGVQYRWALGASGTNFPKVGIFFASPPFSVLSHAMKLVTTDEKKTVIAEFHRARHFMKKQKARLEVQPAGMNMLDHIILTFVFAENKRRERETRARSSGGGC
jgi:predicted Zn-ribbon and HTH transcriptional regulator